VSLTLYTHTVSLSLDSPCISQELRINLQSLSVFSRAEALGAVAQPPIGPVVSDLKDMINAARLVPGDGDLTRRSSVKVEKYNNTKTKEQLVVRMADSERVDFLCLDRKDDIHDGVIKSCRASVILIER